MKITLASPQNDDIRSEITALSEALARFRNLHREEEHELAFSAPISASPLFAAGVYAFIEQKRREGYLISIREHTQRRSVELFERGGMRADTITNMIAELCKGRGDCANALQYMIGELTDNVFEHARTAFGILAYSPHAPIVITIADVGISIPSAYRETGIFIHDDCDALAKALNGLSTKTIEERGRGLSSVTRIITRAFHGSLTLYSGNGMHTSSQTHTACDLQVPYWQGTIVVLSGSFPQESINVYEYL